MHQQTAAIPGGPTNPTHASHSAVPLQPAVQSWGPHLPGRCGSLAQQPAEDSRLHLHSLWPQETQHVRQWDYRDRSRHWYGFSVVLFSGSLLCKRAVTKALFFLLALGVIGWKCSVLQSQHDFILYLNVEVGKHKSYLKLALIYFFFYSAPWKLKKIDPFTVRKRLYMVLIA